MVILKYNIFRNWGGVLEKEVVYSLKNVKKTYVSGSGKTHALDGISFDILKGEVVVILGPSGSRKIYNA